jgi:hypothetical protein
MTSIIYNKDEEKAIGEKKKSSPIKIIGRIR